MKKTAIILNILILWGQGSSLFAKDVDIRGQIVKYNAYYKTYKPQLNIKVDLYQSNTHIHTTYTDTKGFYYFYSIKPNVYTLHVKQKPYKINVKSVDTSKKQFHEIKKFILK